MGSNNRTRAAFSRRVAWVACRRASNHKNVTTPSTPTTAPVSNSRLRRCNPPLLAIYAFCNAVAAGCLCCSCVSRNQSRATTNSLPRKSKSVVLFFCSHSSALCVHFVWLRRCSRSVSRVRLNWRKLALKSRSWALKSIYCTLPNSGCKSASSTCRCSTVTKRFFNDAAYSTSSLQ